MAEDTIRQRLRDRGREIQERLADAVEAMKRNVGEGVRSAVGGSEQRFGRPPSVVRKDKARPARKTRR
jgi:hypothetical protein